jgi:REP element-mobilizing transposase RayT
MTSPIPLQQGVFYHIYNRGNNRENIFIEDRNYSLFLKLYSRYIPPVADTYAYCLLRNHFHFLVRIRTEQELQTLKVSETFRVLNPSQQFSNLFNAYAKTINNAYNRTGSLFQNPFGRRAVVSNQHFIYLIIYIHLNPQRHRLVEDFRSWPYSSYHAFLSTKSTQLQREQVYGIFGGREELVYSHSNVTNFLPIEYLVNDDEN